MTLYLFSVGLCGSKGQESMATVCMCLASHGPREFGLFHSVARSRQESIAGQTLGYAFLPLRGRPSRAVWPPLNTYRSLIDAGSILAAGRRTKSQLNRFHFLMCGNAEHDDDDENVFFCFFAKTIPTSLRFAGLPLICSHAH
jgi:hypothetical protein